MQHTHKYPFKMNKTDGLIWLIWGGFHGNYARSFSNLFLSTRKWENLLMIVKVFGCRMEFQMIFADFRSVICWFTWLNINMNWTEWHKIRMFYFGCYHSKSTVSIREKNKWNYMRPVFFFSVTLIHMKFIASGISAHVQHIMRHWHWPLWVKVANWTLYTYYTARIWSYQHFHWIKCIAPLQSTSSCVWYPK